MGCAKLRRRAIHPPVAAAVRGGSKVILALPCSLAGGRSVTAAREGAFRRARRLVPRLGFARRPGRLPTSEGDWDHLLDPLPDLLAPAEEDAQSLPHGHPWRGNVISAGGEPAVIAPAVHRGHRGGSGGGGAVRRSRRALPRRVRRGVAAAAGIPRGAAGRLPALLPAGAREPVRRRVRGAEGEVLRRPIWSPESNSGHSGMRPSSRTTPPWASPLFGCGSALIPSLSMRRVSQLERQVSHGVNGVNGEQQKFLR
jgi:hypothetical protein